MQVGTGAVLAGKYRIDRLLGAGGMGSVLAATHLGLRQRVAIKLLSRELAHDPDVLARFTREAQAAARLAGEHVARVFDVGELDDGTPYLVMELLDGEDLGDAIARAGSLTPGRAVDLALQVCVALAEAHAAGIVHRDIKPANLFITARPDGSPLVKVLDFGISKLSAPTDVSITRTQAVMGTPSYMAPEQMRSSRGVDVRADVWSLGVVLYECLAGRRPFDGATVSAVCMQVALDPTPPLPAALPRALVEVVYRCLEKSPEARFADVAALAQALAPYAADRRGAEIVVERATVLLRAMPERRRAREPRTRVKMAALGATGTTPPPRAPLPEARITADYAARALARGTEPPLHGQRIAETGVVVAPTPEPRAPVTAPAPLDPHATLAELPRDRRG